MASPFQQSNAPDPRNTASNDDVSARAGRVHFVRPQVPTLDAPGGVGRSTFVRSIVPTQEGPEAMWRTGAKPRRPTMPPPIPEQAHLKLIPTVVAPPASTPPTTEAPAADTAAATTSAPNAPLGDVTQPATTTPPVDDTPFDLASIAPSNALLRALTSLAQTSVLRTFAIAALLASSAACAIVAFDIADHDAYRAAFATPLHFRPRPRIVTPPAPTPPAPIARRERRGPTNRAPVHRAPATSRAPANFAARAMPPGTPPGLGPMAHERLPALCPTH
jgi:hypothetical protein